MDVTYKDFEKVQHNCKRCKGITFLCKPKDGLKQVHECYLEECRVDYHTCDQKIFCPVCKGSGNGVVEKYIPIEVPEKYNSFCCFTSDFKAVFTRCDQEGPCDDCFRRSSKCNVFKVDTPAKQKDRVTFECKRCYEINKNQSPRASVGCLNEIYTEIMEVGVINIGMGISKHDLSRIEKKDVDKPHFKIVYLQDSVLLKPHLIK